MRSKSKFFKLKSFFLKQEKDDLSFAERYKEELEFSEMLNNKVKLKIFKEIIMILI